MSKQTIKALVGALQMAIFDANERNQDSIVALHVIHGHEYFSVSKMSADGEGDVTYFKQAGCDFQLIKLTPANLLAAIEWVEAL